MAVPAQADELVAKEGSLPIVCVYFDGLSESIIGITKVITFAFVPAIIAAAAKIVLEHFGLLNTRLELPSGLNTELMIKSQNEMLRFI